MGEGDSIEGFPIRRLTVERTVRLVATARLRDPVLQRLVSADKVDELAEIEGASSARLAAHERGAGALAPQELVFGVPHATFINAAFSYWRPRELNRFNGPGRGAWYSALKVETCAAEVGFHMTRALERTNRHVAQVDYAELFASFAGEFLDLRDVRSEALPLHPDTAIGYPAGNALAAAALRRGVNGVVYPSVRDPSGTCLVALRPQAVQSVAQGRVLRLAWTGTPRWTMQEVAA